MTDSWACCAAAPDSPLGAAASTVRGGRLDELVDGARYGARPQRLRQRAQHHGEIADPVLVAEPAKLTRGGGASPLVENGGDAALERVGEPDGHTTDGYRDRARTAKGPFAVRAARAQSSRLAGTWPPFSESLRSTCLCSHTFIVALSFVSPV